MGIDGQYLSGRNAQDGSVTDSGQAGGSCSKCGSLEQCWNGLLCVAKLVTMTGGYSIDATEVTRSQYASWLWTSPSTAGQPEYWAWNDSYTPIAEWPQGKKGAFPVVYVDWCDAYAYCAAVGKRLCGSIGGGANRFEEYGNPTQSQWYNACTSNGLNEYPYGNAYDGTTCNGADNLKGASVEVATMMGCASPVDGYGGVYDLAGNVWEWEDSCDGTAGDRDRCRIRGGSSYDSSAALQCGANYVNRVYVSVLLGFRCCSL
jgi:formylglycine-generating enzyme